MRGRSDASTVGQSVGACSGVIYPRLSAVLLRRWHTLRFWKGCHEEYQNTNTCSGRQAQYEQNCAFRVCPPYGQVPDLREWDSYSGVLGLAGECVASEMWPKDLQPTVIYGRYSHALPSILRILEHSLWRHPLKLPARARIQVGHQ